MNTIIQENKGNTDDENKRERKVKEYKTKKCQEKELQREIFELKLKLMNRDAELTALKKEKELEMESKKKLEEIKFIGEQFSNKIGASVALYKTIKKFYEKYNIIIRGGITGSLIRQVLEVPFALKECFDVKGFANPDAHDIDIILEKSVHHSVKEKFNVVFKFFTSELATYIKFQNSYPDAIKNLKIDNLLIVDIYDTTISNDNISPSDSEGKKRLVGIPHIIIKAIDTNKKVYTFDILAHMPEYEDTDIWTNGDYDVNTMLLTQNGIEVCNHDTDILETIGHIRNKEAMCRINLEEYQKKIMTGSLTRTEKIPYLKQLAFYLANRTKILAYGYKNITSEFKIPCIELETKEDCFITACSPPYLTVELECGHKLSVMAYSGEIIKGKNEFNEGIKCPLCRESLLIKFKENLPTSIETFEPSIKNKKKDYPEEKNPLKTKIYSEDSEKYLIELFSSKDETHVNIHSIGLSDSPQPSLFFPETERRSRGNIGESS